VGSRWVIANEETGAENPRTYKSKELRKEGEIWTTPKKVEEKEKEKERERSSFFFLADVTYSISSIVNCCGT